MIAVAELTSLEQLAEYRLLWKTLHARTPNGSFLQSREWLTTTARWLGGHWNWRTLVVTVGTNPIGIVPLVVRPLQTPLGTVRALTFPTADDTVYQGPIGPNPTATLTAALQYLKRARRDWDMIDLRGVDDFGTDRGRTANAFRLAGLPVLHRHWETAVCVDLSRLDAGQQFVLRRRLQSAERTLWRRGRWEHLQAAPSGLAAANLFEPLWDQLEPLLQAHSPMERGYLQEAVLTAAHHEALSVQVVKLQGAAVGCLLSIAGRDRVELLSLVATDAVVRDVLVGRLLFDGVLSGAPRVLFNARQAVLGREWGGVSQPSGRYTHFSAYSPRAQCLRLGQWLRGSSERTAPPKPVALPVPGPSGSEHDHDLRAAASAV